MSDHGWGTMAGTRSWWLIAGLSLAALAQPTVGCLPEGAEATSVASSDLLEDLGPMVVLPTLARFDAALQTLQGEVAAWSAGGDRAPSQVAWLAAMEVWQELEIMAVGPAASSLSDPAGQDLRDEVYSWPTINPCRVDQQTVARAYDAPDFFTANLVNTYGLDALEHLLFAGEDNACPSQVDINATGSWDAMGAAAVDAARAEYAVRVVDGLLATTDALIEAWDPDGGDFSGLIADPGSPDSPYGSDQEALNAVFEGLFYLETTTKDRKLAEPLGLGECSAACGELVESVPSGQSATWVAANLRGFHRVFTGDDGAGFDDLLASLGHGEMADAILEDLDVALALAQASRPDLDGAIVDDEPSVVALYDAVKAVTDALKGDLATVLSLQLPSEAAGDND